MSDPDVIQKYCPFCLMNVLPGQPVRMVSVNTEPRIMHAECVRRAGFHGKEIGRVA